MILTEKGKFSLLKAGCQKNTRHPFSSMLLYATYSADLILSLRALVSLTAKAQGFYMLSSFYTSLNLSPFSIHRGCCRIISVMCCC
jgi:hypothetical protein